jgi:site-specific recombinase XerC
VDVTPRRRVGSGGTGKRPGDAEAPRGRHQEVSPDATATLQPLQLAARAQREAVKNKAYRAFPLGQEAGYFLRFKRKRLTPRSYDEYESCLDKLARYFADLELADFEPPVGTERLEEFMDAHWGASAPRTYNKNLSALREFFKFQVLRQRLHGDPTLPIERAKKRDVFREVFSVDQRRAILAANPELREQTALRLLLDYGLRKGAVQRIQFQHFDHNRRRLTIFTKGEKVQRIPIPQPAFWLDLERLTQDIEARPNHYLLPRQKTHPVRFENRKAVEFKVTRFPEEPMGAHGLHKWWYRCLARAGLVPQGVQSGEKMHKARHTAGQRVVDKTGNLKAAQKLLGHASIQTTGDQYVDWDIDQLSETMRLVTDDE